jgi:hypothetical protein
MVGRMAYVYVRPEERKILEKARTHILVYIVRSVIALTQEIRKRTLV